MLVGGVVSLSLLCGAQQRHLKSLKTQVKEQGEVIADLLKKESVVFEVSLNVTDKTRTNVYGRYNKGTITVPSTKTYVLEVDSTNVRIRNDK